VKRALGFANISAKSKLFHDVNLGPMRFVFVKKKKSKVSCYSPFKDKKELEITNEYLYFEK